MIIHINEPRDNQFPQGIDDFFRVFVMQISYLLDQAVLYAHIPLIHRIACAIHDRAVFYQNIVHLVCFLPCEIPLEADPDSSGISQGEFLFFIFLSYFLNNSLWNT